MGSLFYSRSGGRFLFDDRNPTRTHDFHYATGLRGKMMDLDKREQIILMIFAGIVAVMWLVFTWIGMEQAEAYLGK